MAEQPKQARMSREEFRSWCETQEGRYERIGGVPVAMSPETRKHVRLKYRIWSALDDAIAERDLPCEAVGDGATVEIGEDLDYEPDVSVECGKTTSGDDLTVRNPIVVIEVLSRGSKGTDTGAKLSDYLSVASIQHYLIWHADKRMVVYMQRNGSDPTDPKWHTRMIPGGSLALDPPGISIDIDEIYAKALIS